MNAEGRYGLSSYIIIGPGIFLEGNGYSINSPASYRKKG